MKLKFFKKEKSFRKGGFHTNPDIGWEVVLYLTFVLIAASFVFGFLLFREVNKEFSPSENQGIGRLIDKERLDSALEYFSEREKKSGEIINSPSPIPDPGR